MPDVTNCHKFTWSTLLTITVKSLDGLHDRNTRVNNCLISYYCGMPVHVNVTYMIKQ